LSRAELQTWNNNKKVTPRYDLNGNAVFISTREGYTRQREVEKDAIFHRVVKSLTFKVDGKSLKPPIKQLQSGSTPDLV